jgi:hypothetical protein
MPAILKMTFFNNVIQLLLESAEYTPKEISKNRSSLPLTFNSKNITNDAHNTGLPTTSRK